MHLNQYLNSSAVKESLHFSSKVILEYFAIYQSIATLDTCCEILLQGFTATVVAVC